MTKCKYLAKKNNDKSGERNKTKAPLKNIKENYCFCPVHPSFCSSVLLSVHPFDPPLRPAMMHVIRLESLARFPVGKTETPKREFCN